MLSRGLAALGVAAWSFLTVPAAMVLVEPPGNWIVALGLGLIAPAVLLWQLNRMIGQVERARRGRPATTAREQELLHALGEHGALTPVTAAMYTSLTVDRAATLLDALAQRGDLHEEGHDGSVSYRLVLPARGLAAPDVASIDPSVTVQDREARPASPDQISDAPADEHDWPIEPLSEREREILALLATGRTNRQIADALVVSIGTVKAHTNSIYRKLGVHTRTAAVARARASSLV